MEIEVVEASGPARGQLEATAGAVAVARQLERPRAQPGFALLARAGQATAGYALLAHTRHRLGAAAVEALELATLVAGGVAAREALLGAALAAARAAGLPFLALRRAAAAFAEYGLAPAAFSSRLTMPGAPADARLRPVAPDDLDDLAALHAAAYAALPLSPLRAAPDWRWLLTGGAALLVHEDGRGRAAAYAQIGPGVGGLVVREAGAADGTAARALVSALAAQAGEARGELALELPPEHIVARAALQLGAELTMRAPDPGEPTRLWGVVDFPAALAALLPELEARLAASRYAGWSGRVAIELGGEPVVVAFTAGRPGLAPPDRPPDVALRDVGLAALPQLLLGYRDAGDLRAAGDLRCADTDLGLLDALFPALMPVD